MNPEWASLIPGSVLLLAEYFMVQPLKEGFASWLTSALHLRTRKERQAFFAPSALCLLATFIAAFVLLCDDYPAWPVVGVVTLGGLVEAFPLGWLCARVRAGAFRTRKAPHRSSHRRQGAPVRAAHIALLASVVAMPLLTAGLIAWLILSPPAKTIILVADFDGPAETTKRGVGATIRAQLSTGLAAQSDIAVQALGRVITEQEGSAVARRIGQRRRASIVIWGWYRHGEGEDAEVEVSQHFEVLRPARLVPQLGEEAQGTPQFFALSELESFDVQRLLAADSACLTGFTIGLALLSKNDAAGSIPWFERALADASPKSKAISLWQLHFWRGLGHDLQGDLGRAILDYDQAIRLKPDLTEAYYNRGLAHWRQGHVGRATQDFDEAIRVRPDYAEAYSNRGVVYAEQGDPARAIKDYDEAIRLKPDLAEAYYNRGVAYADQCDLARAIQDYDQAIRLKAHYAEAYSNRGVAYAHQGDLGRAIQDFDEAIRLNPDLAEAYSSRGLAYAQQGDLARAIQDYDQAIRLKPDLAEAYYNRGLAYEANGQREPAVSDFRRALELSQDPERRAQVQDHLGGLGAD